MLLKSFGRICVSLLRKVVFLLFKKIADLLKNKKIIKKNK